VLHYRVGRKQEVIRMGRPFISARSTARRPATARRKLTEMVPVMRPMLPTADRLLPYLRRIDAARMYSNFGPLTIEFQTRLSDHFGVLAQSVVSASCGTTALMGAILGAAGPATEDQPYALVPAFTFAATAAAVERCGYRAYLADVDPDSWMLEPKRIFHHPLLHRIGVVVPVAPFGRPVPQAPWRDFQKRARIPVVIDAAASFDCMSESAAQYLQEIPVVLSFHATKSFGTGEGGCVFSTDGGLVERVAQALNFGFNMTRDSASPSLNGKMSEYHAAVGLAEFDGWLAKRANLQEVVQHYRRQLSSRLLSRFFASPDVSGCYALFLCFNGAEADRVQKQFQRVGVDFRFWYGIGLHRQTHFSDNPRGNLDVTEDLGRRLIGLPMAPDLTEEAIKRVVTALDGAIRKSPG
jgi:dTDP-4-amino-4,6-dideoxygalactose transaminase